MLTHNIGLQLYKKINDFSDFIDNNYNYLNCDKKKILIDNFSKLNWNDLFRFYEITQRKNLLSYQYIFLKLIKKNNIKILIVVNSIYNIGLQEMLWEILCPDDIELS